MPKPKVTKNKIEKAKEFDKIVSDAKQDSYRIHLNLCGKIFEGSGSTALEALKAIPVPEKVTTKGILTVYHNENKKEYVLLIPRVKRLFYPNFQAIVIKQLTLGL